MKYGYEDSKLKDLIGNYKISDDKIIVSYLDGSNREIPLTEENENNLLNLMIEQAQERSQNIEISKLKEERKDKLYNIGSISLEAVASVGIVPFINNNWGGYIVGIMGGILAVMAALEYKDYKIKNDEIKELEKYDIYLSIKDELERLTSVDAPNLFNGVKNTETNLNINTLDNYSLRDIKSISNNLEHGYSVNPVLAKKLGKK